MIVTDTTPRTIEFVEVGPRDESRLRASSIPSVSRKWPMPSMLARGGGLPKPESE
ncbi:MAG: hypothetical protein IPG54_08655 [Sphingomonadales bacterium]|jgi:hypothetical protein|nr:hypothetical protein [Sphingomonadales bacterium]MBK9004901.1 hypothetical protein [Sphingomonadales bacterium]